VGRKNRGVMQTLILINPVAGPPRPEGPASDSGTTGPSGEFFADLMANSAEGLPDKHLTETASRPLDFVVPPETGLPFRVEPMGAVQGLAEAAATPRDAPKDGRPEADINEMNATLRDGLLADLVPDVVTQPSQPVDSAPTAAMWFILQPQVPQDAVQRSTDPDIQGFLAAPLPEKGLLATPLLNPAPMTAVANSSQPVALSPLINPPDRPAAEAAGAVKSSNLAINMQPPPLTENPADVASQLHFGTGPANLEPVEGVMASAMAKLALQVPAPLAAAGSALLWQAGLMTSIDQGDPAKPVAGTDPVPTSADIRDPSAVPIRLAGQITPTFQWADGLVPAMTALAQTDDPDLEMEGATPVSGAWPTHSSGLGGIGHPSASVGLQDLPRLAAQLAGTLVHRPDGQTEVALSPEELGHVRLSMQADAKDPDRLVVVLTFERPETLDLFRRHADQLADALRAAGYSGADISFGRSGGENAGGGADPDRPTPARQDAALLDPDTRSLHPPSKATATGSLDLRL
jgi:hypothetical protein